MPDIPEYVDIKCPSCGHWFGITTRGMTYDDWTGLPQIECPGCGGHSDRRTFGVFIGDGIGGKWCCVEKNPAMTGDLGPDTDCCDDEETCGESGEDVAWQAECDAAEAAKAHGRDPEEGTSRPYPWDGKIDPEPYVNVSPEGENTDGA